MAKKPDMFTPALIAVVIFVVVFYMLRRNEASPFAKALGWVANQMEGFANAPVTTATKCPTGYRFFNDAEGRSLCCDGEINYYSHTCKPRSVRGMCAFEPNVPDPRGGGRKLPLCGAEVERVNFKNANSFCPTVLPNYATKGKCCATGTDMNGEDCLAADLSDRRKYCVIKPKGNEPPCGNLKMGEDAECPRGMTKISYPLGERERSRYGPAVDRVVIPVCTKLDGTCIPDSVIKSLQQKGIYKDKKDLGAWRYSCSGYDRIVNRRDTTGAMDNTYL
jgi:hypothetical protein